MVLLRWIHQNGSKVKAYTFVLKNDANSLIKAFKLFLHSSVHCTQIRPAQWKRWWASHSQHLSLYSSVLTLSLSGHTACLSVTFLLTHDSGSQSVTKKLWERRFCHAPKPTSHLKRKSVFCLWIRQSARLWPESKSSHFLNATSVHQAPPLLPFALAELSLVDKLRFFFPQAIATKVAPRMFSKGDLKAWPIKWRQGQIFRLKQPDLLRHTERWRGKE